MNPGLLESQMDEAWESLQEATEEYARLAELAGDAEVRYKIAFSRAMLSAVGNNIPDREAQAIIATAKEFQARRSAEARLAAQKERLSTGRANLDRLRTIAANVRASTT